MFSIAIVMLGLSAAVRGTWVERVGPRKSMFTAACFWAAGFLVGALGIATKQLWLLYLGYGFIGGIGLGIGYISPVSTLIKWFPDRPGMATGLAIMGFGGGALIASPLSQQLMSWYDPDYNPSVASSVPSGSAVAMLFVTLGIIYFLVMMYGVFNIKVPPEGWRPAGFDPATLKAKTLVTTNNVSAGNAIRTPQFYFLWLVLFCNVTAGIGILEQASPMIQDFFRSDAGVSTVTVAAAGGFVGHPVAGQHGRPVRLVLDVRLHRPQADLHGLPRRRHHRLPGARHGRAQRDLAVRAAGHADHLASTAAGSRPSRPTCVTCSARSRSARSTAGCSPRGRPPASPGR